MKHLSIKVTGNVQGVFFRASAKEVAIKLSINGYVKNQPDGSVYIEAEGVEEKLDQFIEWCRSGPPRAHVTHVDFQEGDVKHFESFEIKR